MQDFKAKRIWVGITLLAILLLSILLYAVDRQHVATVGTASAIILILVFYLHTVYKKGISDANRAYIQSLFQKTLSEIDKHDKQVVHILNGEDGIKLKIQNLEKKLDSIDAGLNSISHKLDDILKDLTATKQEVINNTKNLNEIQNSVAIAKKTIVKDIDHHMTKQSGSLIKLAAKLTDVTLKINNIYNKRKIFQAHFNHKIKSLSSSLTELLKNHKEQVAQIAANNQSAIIQMLTGSIINTFDSINSRLAMNKATVSSQIEGLALDLVHLQAILSATRKPSEIRQINESDRIVEINDSNSKLTLRNYFKDNKLKESDMFKDGHKVYSTLYNDDGSKVQSISFDDLGTETEVIEYYPSGEIKSRKELDSNSNDYLVAFFDEKGNNIHDNEESTHYIDNGEED